MESIFNYFGMDGLAVKEDLRKSLDESKTIYIQRMFGVTNAWSATTRCIKCGDYWMWGVKDNLKFICSKCQNQNELQS